MDAPKKDHERELAINHKWNSSAEGNGKLQGEYGFRRFFPEVPDYDETIPNIEQQWRAFISDQPVDTKVMREFILDSWRRSKEAGVDPNLHAYKRVDESHFQQILLKNKMLIDVARPMIETLLTFTNHANSLIILTDADGVVLHTGGVGVTPVGSILTESVHGTNGVGTCLAVGKPVYIMGPEHYVKSLHLSHCSGSPIFDSNNNIIGVMSLAVKRSGSHYHSLGMLQATTETIAKEMRLRELLNEQKVICEVLNEGIIVIDHEGTIRTINRYARHILKVNERIIGQSFDSLFNLGQDLVSALKNNIDCCDLDTNLQLKDGTDLPCLLSISFTEKGYKIISVRENQRTREITRRVMGAKAAYTFQSILGESQAIRAAVNLATLASRSDSTTLIQGESGTGKELFAHAIHHASSRSTGPFIVLNCGAIPRDLIQSELFGYEGGAFTGAQRGGAPGKFELADGGTIFLDEIGDMPLSAQVNLLRVLQEGEVVRVGGVKRQLVDVRIIAATNKDLVQAVAEGTFRADLFYRLNVLTITAPPLRAHQEDIPLLAAHFLKKFANSLRKRVDAISEDALQQLMSYSWPGNIRELENVIERAVNITSRTVIGPNELNITSNSFAQHQPFSIPTGSNLRSKEIESIISMLRENDGNLRATAQQLGISRSGLYNKIQRYGISPSEYRK